MIYFTADLHLGHANVIQHCNRPFETADEMDTAIINIWNETVRSDDEVYILGDLTMRPASEAHEYLNRLSGRKYFIRGNHDRFLKNYELYETDFEWIKNYYVLRFEGRSFVLFHYPIMEWDGFFRDAIHLYGHVHNSQTSSLRLAYLDGLAFNVGVDVNGFRPIGIYEILASANQK